ncbi:MAG: histidine kinase dimerization/phosphoacceptor domain -containing protein [Pseudomonadota bacterium]
MKRFGVFSRLRARLAIIIAAALAPAGVLAVSLMVRGIEVAEERRITDFEASSLIAADEERTALAEIRRSVRQATLETQLILEERGSCEAAASRLFTEADWAIAPTIYAADGAPFCGASTASIAKEAVWLRYRETDEYTVSTVKPDPQHETRAFFAIRAVPGDANLAVGVGVDARFLRSLVDPSADDKSVALIGPKGDEFLLNRADVLDWLPADRAPLQTLGDRSVVAVDADGRERRYFVSVLESGQLWLVSVAPLKPLEERLMSGEALAAATPILLWLIAVAVAYFAIDILVTRHVGRIRRAAMRIGDGDLDVVVGVPKDAPAELQALGRAVMVMRDKIADREASLTETLDIQRRLLLEVHHRVKNNLQMISSIFNLERRRTSDPKSDEVMTAIQNRIHGLAMVHQNLYAAERLEEVALDQLTRDIVEHLMKSLSAGRAREEVKLELEPLTASTTLATPIALFVSEAIGNALKHGASPLGLSVTLRRTDGVFELIVANNAEEAPVDTEGNRSLGQSLMSGFAKQIGAEFTSERKGGRFTVSVAGALRPDAELFSVRRRAA